MITMYKLSNINVCMYIYIYTYMYEWPRNPIIGRHETIIGRPEIYGMKMMNKRTICGG